MARNPRRGASRATERQVPGWVWLFSGIVTGLFIAFLYHLASLRFDAAQTDPPPRQAAADAPAGDEADSGPRFDFYAVLPKMEVIVPKSEEGGGSNARPRRPDRAETRQHESFLLQAGSFRRAEDADRRRAELILQGYEVRVQAVELESGDTWHRVMIGPFDNLNALHRAQDKLVSAGIETLPIRVRKEG